MSHHTLSHKEEVFLKWVAKRIDGIWPPVYQPVQIRVEAAIEDRSRLNLCNVLIGYWANFEDYGFFRIFQPDEVFDSLDELLENFEKTKGFSYALPRNSNTTSRGQTCEIAARP